MVAGWSGTHRAGLAGCAVVSDTARHAGQADILRESIDRRAGRDKDSLGDEMWWADYVATIDAAANRFRR